MPVPVALPQPAGWPADGAVAEWYLPDGAAVRAGDPVCRFETNFVSLDLDAEGDGILTYRHGLAGCPVDGVLGVIVSEGEALPDFDVPEALPATETEDSSEPRTEVASDGEIPVVDQAAQPAADATEVPGDCDASHDEAQIAHEPRAGQSEPFQEWRFEPPRPGVEVPPHVDEEPEQARPASVLAFPRRFVVEPQSPGSSAWDAVPGDAVDFASALIPQLEAGGQSGAPAWMDSQVDSREDTEEPVEDWGWQRWMPSERPTADLEPRAAAAQTLFIRVTVDLGESHKMRDQLALEWRAQGMAPSTEDILLRAVARALRELPQFDVTHNVALRSFTPEAETFRVLAHAAERPFRDAVLALNDPSDATAEADYDCVVTSFAALGIEDATPRLEAARPLALVIGAEREIVAIQGDHAAARVAASMVLAYDAAMVDDGTAARLLARIRGLIEAPYALLAD